METLKTKVMQVKGKVVHGAGDGKKLGFPTANIALTQPLEVKYGVYACCLLLGVEGQTEKHPGVLHYGPRLVFAETKPLFEVHLFNFDREIYDQEVEVEIKDFIRETRNFDSLDKLVKQIKDDCEQARIKLKILN